MVEDEVMPMLTPCSQWYTYTTKSTLCMPTKPKCRRKQSRTCLRYSPVNLGERVVGAPSGDSGLSVNARSL